MARHARSRRSPLRLPRSVVRAGLTASAGATLVAAAAAQASATSPAHASFGRTDVMAAVDGMHTALQKSVAGLSPVIKTLPVNPLAKTPVDPLNNQARTQVADFKPVSTSMVTGPLSVEGGKVQNVPVAGGALSKLLP
ncbi:hypothetical protein ACIHFE_18580 [Streptomyces sp. NPDC052396]|uniref:hypothetical protein n=1 Tax=Streptomyces sp. NPDC052396 TaxID=3365689 RepID=UPI0037D854A2